MKYELQLANPKEFYHEVHSTDYRCSIIQIRIKLGILDRYFIFIVTEVALFLAYSLKLELIRYSCLVINDSIC